MVRREEKPICGLKSTQHIECLRKFVICIDENVLTVKLSWDIKMWQVFSWVACRKHRDVLVVRFVL